MLNDKKNNGFSLAPDNTKPSGSLIYRIIKRGFDVLFSAVLMIPVGILIGIFFLLSRLTTAARYSIWLKEQDVSEKHLRCSSCAR